MPPQAQAPGAIPLVFHAEITGLLAKHEVELVTVAGLEPGEHEAVQRLANDGLRVRSVQRVNPRGLKRWQRRWRMGSAWLSGRYPWRTIWFWEPELQHILDQTLAEESFDLLLVEDNSMGIYTYRTQIPTLYTEHEVRMPRPVDWQSITQPDVLRWSLRELDWMRWKRYLLSVWRRFDRIQAFTDRDAARISTLAPDLKSKVRVNPFGVDLPAGADPSLQEEGSLLFVGNFTHTPNVDAALWLGKEIMPLLRQLSPDVRLALVGTHPPSQLRELACDDIIVTGRVENIDPYFEKASVVVAPVRIGGGMRMKVLQSMGMGKAIVTTPRGAEGLSIDGQQPPLMIAEDAQGIASAISNLLADRERRISLGQLARDYVACHFSAQAYADRIETIYREMMLERGLK